MSIFDEFISSIKNRIQPVHQAEHDLPVTNHTSSTNAAAPDENAEGTPEHLSEPDPEILLPVNQAAGELSEVQINKVIETSDGVKQDVDPRRFRVHNPARNQSLDIVISSHSISRSLTGLQGDDKA